MEHQLRYALSAQSQAMERRTCQTLWIVGITVYVVFVKIYKRFLCIKAYVTLPLRTILGNPTHAWNFHHSLYSTWIRYTCAIYVIHKCFMRFAIRRCVRMSVDGFVYTWCRFRTFCRLKFLSVEIYYSNAYFT
mgnify:CR=1 FL=1